MKIRLNKYLLNKTCIIVYVCLFISKCSEYRLFPCSDYSLFPLVSKLENNAITLFGYCSSAAFNYDY